MGLFVSTCLPVCPYTKFLVRLQVNIAMFFMCWKRDVSRSSVRQTRKKWCRAHQSCVVEVERAWFDYRDEYAYHHYHIAARTTVCWQLFYLAAQRPWERRVFDFYDTQTLWSSASDDLVVHATVFIIRGFRRGVYFCLVFECLQTSLHSTLVVQTKCDDI